MFLTETMPFKYYYTQQGHQAGTRAYNNQEKRN